MNNSQNSSSNKDQPTPIDDEKPFRDGTASPKESYYYDDSTGYKIYDEETEDEEQNNSR